jgi:hypothetical protein
MSKILTPIEIGGVRIKNRVFLPGHTTNFGVNNLPNALPNAVPNAVNRTETRKKRRNDTSKVCSVKVGYQDLSVDVNDTLCQSYSLMAYLSVPFDSTPSAEATVEQKFQKQLSMIQMYREILADPSFIKELDGIVKNRNNKELWTDTVDDTNTFFIIKKYKKTSTIVTNILRVLNIWEKYGWQFFVGDGKCKKLKQDGGKRKTRKRGYRQVPKLTTP